MSAPGARWPGSRAGADDGEGPGTRYQTPAEVAAALAPYCVREAPAKPPAPRRAVGFSRRSAALVSAAVLLLGLAGWSFGPAVYRITTNRGVVVIQTEDTDVEVRVKRAGEEIALIDSRTKREVVLPGRRMRAGTGRRQRRPETLDKQVHPDPQWREVVRVWLEQTAEAKPPVTPPVVPPDMKETTAPPSKPPVKPQPPAPASEGVPPLAGMAENPRSLTVAQDGTDQSRSIQVALKALKTGQVVKVLDQGPYRERLDVTLPKDVVW